MINPDGNEDEDRKLTVLTYIDHSFKQDLSFIDGLVKARFSYGPTELAVEKAVNKYMIVCLSLDTII